MSELVKQISDLRLKVEKLVNLHERLLKENAELVKNEKSLKDQAFDYKQEIAELKEKNKLIKVAHAVSESNQNTRDIKIKINEYVREIDRCIGLINR